MYSFKLRAATLFILLSFLGCTQDNGTPAQPASPDYGKPISEALNPFTVEGSEIDKVAVSAAAEAKMLACDVPTTEKRRSGDNFGLTYKVVTRVRQSVDSHFLVRDEDRGYSTSISGGALFKRTYTLNRLSVDGISALSSGLSYRDICTDKGCDEKQREYLAGSSAYLVEVDSNLKKIYHDLDVKGMKDCDFAQVPGTAVRSLIGQGSVTLNGQKFKAVRYSTTEEGDLNCKILSGNSASLRATVDDGSSGSVYMGKATRYTTQVVLADILPQLNNDIPRLDTTPCSRSIVMSNEYVQSGGRIYKGRATEIVSATISGTILTVEQFEKHNEDLKETVQRLHNAQMVAASDKGLADQQLYNTQTAAKNARDAVVPAQQAATQAEQQITNMKTNDPDLQRTKDRAADLRAQAMSAEQNANRLEHDISGAREKANNNAVLAQLAADDLARAEAELAKAQAADLN